VQASTRRLWDKQDRHEGDRKRLFSAVEGSIGGREVLYPGSFVDIAPSFIYPSVTYVDTDRRTPRFFADVDGVREIILSEGGTPDRRFRFIHGDYRENLELVEESFDLLVSLYAGLVSEHCTNYLKVGGLLLVAPSHGDVAMASLDDRYQLAGVVTSRSGEYRVRTDDLDSYLIPKKPTQLTSELIRLRQRGIPYTKSPFAYLFRRSE
jgi:hypothetical protein